MPMPVSRTLMTTSSFPRRVLTTTSPLDGVYLMALEIRFTIARSIGFLSIAAVNACGAVSKRNVNVLLSAIDAQSCNICWTIGFKSWNSNLVAIFKTAESKCASIDSSFASMSNRSTRHSITESDSVRRSGAFLRMYKRSCRLELGLVRSWARSAIKRDLRSSLGLAGGTSKCAAMEHSVKVIQPCCCNYLSILVEQGHASAYPRPDG